MQTTTLLETELNFRLGYSQLALDNHPETAIPRMRCFAWFAYSNQLFVHAWLLQQLRQPELAQAARLQTLPAASHAFGYADSYDYYNRLMNCFKHALLSGNAKAASEWAEVLQKSQHPNQQENFYYYVPFYRLLTSLWLGQPLDFAFYQKAMDKVAALKSSHYPTGTVAVMHAIAASDAPAAALALDEILVYHAKKSR